MKINMTQTCKQNNITEFSRTRGGWMKLVEGYNPSENGAYKLVGSNFVKVGNFDTDLHNGLYLDCSKPVIDGEKVEIMNLFKIEDGNVELLNSIPKSTRGWANEFEEDVNSYFASEGVTAQDILKKVKNMSCNKDILHEVARELLKDEREKVWLNESHLDAFLITACVHKDNYHLTSDKVQEMAVKLYHNSYEAERYFGYNINNDHQCRMLYSVLHCNPHFKRHYSDFKVIFEDIDEDYYSNMSKLEELRNYNNNVLNITGGKAFHDIAYWYSFQGMYSNTRTIYIVVPNVIDETIKIQRFELHL